MAPSVSASVRRVRRSDGICDQRAVTVAGISPALQRPTATAALYNSFAKTKVASLRRTSRTRSPSRSRWMAGTAGFACTSRVKPVQPRQVSSGKRRRGQQRPDRKAHCSVGPTGRAAASRPSARRRSRRSEWIRAHSIHRALDSARAPHLARPLRRIDPARSQRLLPCARHARRSLRLISQPLPSRIDTG